MRACGPASSQPASTRRVQSTRHSRTAAGDGGGGGGAMCSKVTPSACYAANARARVRIMHLAKRTRVRACERACRWRGVRRRSRLSRGVCVSATPTRCCRCCTCANGHRLPPHTCARVFTVQTGNDDDDDDSCLYSLCGGGGVVNVGKYRLITVVSCRACLAVLGVSQQ